MLDHEFMQATRALKEFYGQTWHGPRLQKLKADCKSKRITQVELAEAIEKILRQSNQSPKLDTIIKRALVEKKNAHYAQQNAKLMEQSEEQFCKTCFNTTLVECKTEHEKIKVVFAQCPECNKQNQWALPKYKPDLVIINRWHKWQPSKQFSFEQLHDKWTHQVKESRIFYSLVDQNEKTA